MPVRATAGRHDPDVLEFLWPLQRSAFFTAAPTTIACVLVIVENRYVHTARGRAFQPVKAVGGLAVFEVIAPKVVQRADPDRASFSGIVFGQVPISKQSILGELFETGRFASITALDASAADVASPKTAVRW